MKSRNQRELKRVVVTGMGSITPLQNDPESFWQQLLVGRSGVSRITYFDTSHHRCQIAAEVKGFEASDYLSLKAAKRTERCIQFAIAGARQALDDAQFSIDALNASQVGVVIGTAIGGIRIFEAQANVYAQKGPDRCSPFLTPMTICNMAAAQVAIQIGATGPCFCPATACAAGSNAIGDAFRLIQLGHVQAVIAGGTEAPITPLVIAGFEAARVVSTLNQEPEKASRPFDKSRDGFVIGEGSGILLLEELEHALRRGKKIYAELIGYGASCDAHHITSPLPTGAGAAQAMRLAIEDADLSPGQVNYINAHGTSTLANDAMEIKGISLAFGELAPLIPINSTKSMTGHLLGAAGGIEAIATIMTITKDQIPATLNLQNPDTECDLDFVTKESRHKIVDVAMSNSFGFGGHNVSLIFRKFPGMLE
ncbi:beta-ketoacyl-ACP synthase II [Gloeobacter violaceus]|uniref:3-oxoacyl-[acyl-carrier-protein] synthase 2 n=1 Tax=Gloeobacter violaceus (strain ATCC 29082 / PCC 7421) TaxID=251221 RepID=Q7NLN0_GLOVI|nr:beta-ketoacyl-ACP synthase II [Gloeobacter violaceus]BAC89032.1 3-oxoacyl-[acyl-carrier-protein] synthase beta chain [Gloeobacter violaceus PCC 7421]